MKRKIVFFVNLIITALAIAAPITKEEAQRKAEDFWLSKGAGGNHQVPRPVDVQATGTQAYYVFNAEDNNGFVIIGGDNQGPDVLGYSDVGQFDPESMSPALESWLKDYAHRTEPAHARQTINRQQPTTRASRAAIKQMLQTQWGQDFPYNLLCPTDFNGNQ